MCSCLTSMVLCLIVIQSTWRTWNDHPVTVAFNDKTTQIETIPFPAVTICTTQKLKENLMKVDENDGIEQLFPGE